jgi:hypothetical protein
MLLQLKLSKNLARHTAGFFYGRAAANQERGTKNQEQPRSGSLIQHSLFNIHHSDRLPQSAGRAAGITQKGDRQYLKKLISFSSN